MTVVIAPDGTELHVLDTGDGPPVVLLHGWTVGAELWEHLLTSLPGEGHRCIAPDRRGCGRSGRPWAGYDYDTLADDLAAVLDHLDVQDATVVAHSLAVGEAVRYLVRHGSGRVDGLVLVAPTSPVVQPPDVVDALGRAMAADLPAFLDAGAPAFFGGSASPAMLSWGVGLARRASWRASIELVRTMAGTDLTADLAAVDVPTVVLHGDADATAPIETTGTPTAQLVPGARLEVVAGGPHGLPLTHATDVAAAIRSVARSGLSSPAGPARG